MQSERHILARCVCHCNCAGATCNIVGVVDIGTLVASDLRVDGLGVGIAEAIRDRSRCPVPVGNSHDDCIASRNI